MKICLIIDLNVFFFPQIDSFFPVTICFDTLYVTHCDLVYYCVFAAGEDFQCQGGLLIYFVH